MEKLKLDIHGPTHTKLCSKCGKTKSTQEFYKDTSKNDQLTWDCMECRKSRSRLANRQIPSRDPEARRAEKFMRKYGITIDEWDQRYVDQDGRCMICAVDLPAMGQQVHTDHCHNHGEVRGILCLGCNAGLGQSRDNPATLRAAAEYIEDDTEAYYRGEDVDVAPVSGGLRGYLAGWKLFWAQCRGR